jgi:hypothetical protein
MCVLLCANSSVRESLGLPLALAHRETLELCPTYPNVASANAPNNGDCFHRLVDTIEIDDGWQLHIMKRSAWLQAYCRYRAQRADHREAAEWRVSAREWQKAFETLAKTCGRILSLVGLRRWL